MGKSWFLKPNKPTYLEYHIPDYSPPLYPLGLLDGRKGNKWHKYIVISYLRSQERLA